ncbi:probable E3 ubiquitin-protein ligase EDA40 [Cajanus cajan]|nr:probable E3 ubiquitin-protein ligase EDA40 [Cajanus cajan]
MVSGWRKTFRTSNNMPQNTSLPDSDYYDNTDPCPRITSDFSLFSTPPSIPHTLRCPTNTKRTTPSPSSTLSFLKATLHLSKRSCGICTHTVKFGQGKAIFTAECSHVFHFPCIAAHVRNHPILTCPVCNANWKQLQNAHQNPAHHLKTTKSFNYNDDEPLMSPTSVSRFNPIPESNENEEEEDDDEEQPNDQPISFRVSPSLKTRNIEACFSPEAAIVASNRSSETYVALFKVKAPPRSAPPNRPPVDLVTVLDLSGNASSEELRMLKRSMQVVISSLGSADRLSVVAFSGGSKRLFPLRRMTGRGQTAARRVVDALTELRHDGAPARNDALKKAAKVLEDRRQNNTIAKIILLTNNHEDQRLSSTRFPVHSLRISLDGACDHAHRESELAKRVGNLLSVVAQDFRVELKLASRSAPAEIAAVYSLSKSFTAALSPDSAALGDLHAAEERELLLEFKVPGGTASRGSQSQSQSHHHFISVRCSHRDPFTQELVNSKERELIVPRPHTVRSCDRLRRCHVSARAVAESRRLVARNNVCGAVQLLSSARALVSREQGDECLQWLEAELRSQKLRSGSNWMEDKGEPLTPMSAWRVAERLAKVAIMRKSMNRVSDLHGFEDARF